MVRTHYPGSLQPSLAVHPRTYPSNWQLWHMIDPRHFSVLPTVVFHPCCRRYIQTTAAVFRLISSEYSRQAGVSGFWFHRLERPSAPSLALFRQRLETFLFSLSYQNHMTRVTVTIHHCCLDTCIGDVKNDDDVEMRFIFQFPFFYLFT